MRVLQLISSSGLYGAENAMLGLSEGLERLGSRSIIGIFRRPGQSISEMADLAVTRGLQLESVPCSGKLDLNTILVIRQIISRERIDFVHSHGYKAHLYAYLAARNSCPLIATCHGHYTRSSSRRIPSLSDVKLRAYRSLERNVLQHFDLVACVSEETSVELRRAGLPAENLTVIANAVDVETFHGATPSADIERVKCGRVAVGIVSRLIERKGHRELFQSARDVLSRYPNTAYFVVGDGPLRSDLERLVAESGIASSVIFPGRRGDMPNIYSALDMVVLPSHAEGLPMVVIEAMAAQKPVIASNVGGIPELVFDGKTGLLIERGNHVSLRNAILRLLQDPALGKTLGTNAWQFVRQSFSLEAMGRNYLAQYRRTAERRMLALAAAV